MVVHKRPAETETSDSLAKRLKSDESTTESPSKLLQAKIAEREAQLREEMERRQKEAEMKLIEMQTMFREKEQQLQKVLENSDVEKQKLQEELQEQQVNVFCKMFTISLCLYCIIEN